MSLASPKVGAVHAAPVGFDPNDPQYVDPFGVPDQAYRVPALALSNKQALLGSPTTIIIEARAADLRWQLGSITVVADSMSHWLAQGDAREIRVGANTHIAAIRAGTKDGVLEVTTLVR